MGGETVKASFEWKESLSSLLREYAAKLTELNRELEGALSWNMSQTLARLGYIALLFDRASRYDQPLRELVNLGTQIIESGDSDRLLGIELFTRVGETEAELHHMLRFVEELKARLKEMTFLDRVARLRESAGLNAMKGGPLRTKG